jgi:hypothetical protein
MKYNQINDRMTFIFFDGIFCLDYSGDHHLFLDWKRVQLFANRIALAGVCVCVSRRRRCRMLNPFVPVTFIPTQTNREIPVCWESFRLWTDDAQALEYIGRQKQLVCFPSSFLVCYFSWFFFFCIIHPSENEMESYMKWWWYDIRFRHVWGADELLLKKTFSFFFFKFLNIPDWQLLKFWKIHKTRLMMIQSLTVLLFFFF